ncbi:MAG TPA: serine/threonine-protein kinase [Ktedonobacterales bacterium]|nr:serine/threonine-protein kinase [Ktedonobacterales bacterium]
MPGQRAHAKLASGGSIPLADRYRVLARVGLGGTAVVYRCVDLHTERIVAVKVLRTNGPLIPEAAARLRREAHLAASFSHPHVVRVLDYGYTVPLAAPPVVPWAEESNQPVPYITMEYVFGSTLKQLLRKHGPLPLEWVWELGDQLCAALGMAHSLGVVHRDVKPQNVMIVDSHVELLSKLTDFGIARQVGGDLTTLTATGQVLGTPDYLSPEQVLGEPGGPAADIYALGIVLYELITGRLPFAADTPLAAASRRMVVDAPPLTTFRRDVPWPLQEVILLALRREATDRYANARDFAQALRWSRERSPAVPPAPRGSWVLDARPPKAPKPAPEAIPLHSAPEPGEESFEEQSTVLRVASKIPGLDDEPARPTPPLIPEPPDALISPDAESSDGADENGDDGPTT